MCLIFLPVPTVRNTVAFMRTKKRRVFAVFRLYFGIFMRWRLEVSVKRYFPRVFHCIVCGATAG